MQRSSEMQQKTEEAISFILLIGVVMSAFVLLVGVGIACLFTRNISVSTYKMLQSPQLNLIQGLQHGNAQSFMTLGIIILLFTPLLRIVVSVVAFSLQRDWIYVGITTCVLCIIVGSMILNH
jgi:uncharacterized membrane protein